LIIDWRSYCIYSIKKWNPSESGSFFQRQERLMTQITDTDLKSGELFDRALSNIRHLLGNSVSTLKITLEVLLENYDQFDETKKNEFLERAVNQVALQQRLLESMKTYSRSVVNRIQTINFDEFWHDWIQEKREELAGEGIRLMVEEPEKPCYVLGESKVLNLVFNAVIANAIEALMQIDDPLIEITSFASDDLRIVIRDNGCGIEKDKLEKVFIPFYSKDSDKSGLGLPLARKLLVAMGGGIAVDSRPGEGTSVCIQLKRAHRDRPPG